jgi:hypothetical protein
MAEGVPEPTVRDGLRWRAFLGSETFVARTIPADDRLRQVPPTQRSAGAPPLGWLEQQSARRRDAMARASQAGACTMQDTARHFGVHDATVSSAVCRRQAVTSQVWASLVIRHARSGRPIQRKGIGSFRHRVGERRQTGTCSARRIRRHGIRAC